mmetsp:Transcript_16444/g.35245  ORF Transcript_16444/g.35245 Transcript_16444/m.35245 type:complete len:314 (+) Transcript_16444:652-1593(+)
MERTPPMVSSICAPKMMLASGSAISKMASAAAFTSCSVISLEPVMVKTMPVACAIGKSMRGEETAATAASRARVLPSAVPMPMSASPESPITACTSAKSTLMSPGLMMMSEMPTTPWRRMSSATQKASCSGVPSSTRSSSRSLETTIIASTCDCSLAIAASACRILRAPSKEKGLVTTPTVSAPAALAHSATIGAAPEPVPPPMPATTNTMSELSTICDSWSMLSSAAARPLSGLPPAPRPRDVSAPNPSLFGESDASSAWMSVFTAQYSTALDCAWPYWIMRLTALPPPPPTPTTLITHGLSVISCREVREG